MITSAFLLALAAAAFFIAVTWWFPIVWTRRFKISGADKKAGVEDSCRKTVAQVLGGAAIVLAFAWSWIKDNETIGLTRIQTSNQQFTDAATLIANKDVDARTAAIYSMENLVGTTPQYQTPVLNVLKSVIKTHLPAPAQTGAALPKALDDALAAIYVLGRLPPAQSGIDMQYLYLAGGNFQSAVGFRAGIFYSAALYGANFSSADLTGTIFDGAQMADWQAVGSANWSDDLWTAWMTTLQWQRVQYVAIFNYAKLANASFNGTSVSGAFFQYADLSNAQFIGTDLSRADFQNAVNLDKAKFENDCYGPPGQPVGLSDEIMKSLKTPC